MSVEAYELRDINADSRGAVLVCNTTGIPLPLSHNRFDDVEDAAAFLQWLECGFERDPRDYDSGELSSMVDRWIDAGRPGAP